MFLKLCTFPLAGELLDGGLCWQARHMIIMAYDFLYLRWRKVVGPVEEKGSEGAADVDGVLCVSGVRGADVTGTPALSANKPHQNITLQEPTREAAKCCWQEIAWIQNTKNFVTKA